MSYMRPLAVIFSQSMNSISTRRHISRSRNCKTSLSGHLMDCSENSNSWVYSHKKSIMNRKKTNYSRVTHLFDFFIQWMKNRNKIAFNINELYCFYFYFYALWIKSWAQENKTFILINQIKNKLLKNSL